MRVVVFGATGNTGTSLLRLLASDDAIDSVTGVARRSPQLEMPKVRWVAADIVRAVLEPIIAGADAVVHLAWLIQPSHNTEVIRRANLIGTERILKAAALTGVRSIVYASSVGVYSPGPKDDFVDEGWPRDGIITSPYSRQKSAVEKMLDRFERDFPEIRVVRIRPALVFKAGMATAARRYFMGPFFPRRIARPVNIPVMPVIPGLVTQCVHSLDAAHAYRLALVSDARGAFNVATDPVVDPRRLAEVLGKRTVTVPARPLRSLVKASWNLHLQPTHPEWLDMGLGTPLMSTSRIRRELGWRPEMDSDATILELLEAIAEGSGLPTPPLRPDSISSRMNEIGTGVGQT